MRARPRPAARTFGAGPLVSLASSAMLLALVVAQGWGQAADAAATATPPEAVDALRASEAADAFTEAIRAFADQVQADVTADDVGGITAGVFQGPHLLWARGFGHADREARTPAGVGTIYRVGSISKTFTALLLAILVQDGVMELDDPVEGVLPAVGQVAERPPGAPAVTYRQLASHTAGWTREPSDPQMVVGPIDRWEERVLESIPLTSYYGPPGRSYRYSNIGFGVLGLAVSRAAGRPFMELVTDRIIEPLGLEGTTFVTDERLTPRLAAGYANGGDRGVDAEQPAREHAGRGYKVPNGGVYSTVQDLARFAAAITGHGVPRILDAPLRAEMLSVQTPEDPEAGYGLGLSIRTTDDGHVLAGHGGSVAGYNAYLVFDVQSGLGVVLLRNYNSGRTNLGAASGGLLEALLAAGSEAPGAAIR